MYCTHVPLVLPLVLPCTVQAYFKQRLGLDPVDETRAYTTFLVPRDLEPRLISFLGQLECDAPGLGVTDTQMSLTSLEEVFLAIARKVGDMFSFWVQNVCVCVFSWARSACACHIMGPGP